MSGSDYFSFLTELPHLVLTFLIGFLSILVYLPFILLFLFPPAIHLDFILIFTYFWKNILVSWSGVNTVFYSVLLVSFSFLAGFIFVGLYDLIGHKIINGIAKYFDIFLKKISKKYRERKKYYDIFKKAEGNDEKVKQYDIGTEKYAKIQFNMYKPENRYIRSYYNWEFIKDASCSYLAFLIIIFWIVLVIYYILSLMVKLNNNVEFSMITYVFLIVSIIGFFSLIYGHLFYGSARIQARLKAYKFLDK